MPHSRILRILSGMKSRSCTLLALLWILHASALAQAPSLYDDWRWTLFALTVSPTWEITIVAVFDDEE